MSAKETLENVYQQYISSQEIYNSAKIRTKCDNDFAIKIIPAFQNVKKQRQEHVIDSYFEQLDTNIKELYILNIITTFEKIAFDRIDNASGIIGSIITTEYNKRHLQSIPLRKSAASLIKSKEDIFSLSGVRNVLEKQLSKDSFRDLKEIVEYRNWLSHGKRHGVGMESILNITEIKDILMDIIDEIG